jgi:hypothetical protein
MKSRIAQVLLVMGLTLSAHVAAQQVPQSSASPDSSASFFTAHALAKAPVDTSHSPLLSASTDASVAVLLNKSLVDDPAVVRFQENTWNGNNLPHRDTTQLAGIFKAPSLATPANRLLFYVTAPYWLPRSRPFPNNSNPPAQPVAHSALINDVASLLWPGSGE